MSTLYVVATPIGNLEDITYRAVRVLGEVSAIAAEDTRTAKTLLQRYRISTPLVSYHDHSQRQEIDLLLDKLRLGDMALISEAGTPGINDPGYALINAALEEGHRVVPVPGPSAPITALSASGLPTDAFYFGGYLPRKTRARRQTLAELSRQTSTLIFLETPHRLQESLDDILETLGDRELAVARELTKMHEEIFRGSVNEARDHYRAHAPRGEITLVIQGAGESDLQWSEEKLEKQLTEALTEERWSASRLAKKLAKESGWPRREIYDRINQLKS